jgi:hypothetical protein
VSYAAWCSTGDNECALGEPSTAAPRRGRTVT